MQADLKRRLSQLRKSEQKSAQSKGPDPFHVPKTGAGQVVLVGPPNTGKSSLLAATTKAEVKVADYPFTTAVPQPGVWHHDDIPIELVDTPPLTPEHVPAGLMGTIRNADVVCVVVNGGDAVLEQAEEALALLRTKGVELRSAPRAQLPEDPPGLHPGLMVLSKADLAPPEAAQALRDLFPGLQVVPVSAQTRQGLQEWFRALWALLAVIRVYAKEPGQPPDMHRPFVLPSTATVADLARQIHRDLPDQMKYARLWGHSRFEGQQVHKTEVLRDRDVVEIHE